MKYFLILLGIGLVLAPWLMLQPGSKQRNTIALRNKAIKLGLTVKKDSVPLSSQTAISYRYVLPVTKQRPKFPQWSYVLDDGIWEGDGLTGELEEKLAAMKASFPKGTIAIACQGQILAFFWDESGEEGDVEEIRQLATKLVEILRKST